MPGTSRKPKENQHEAVPSNAHGTRFEGLKQPATRIALIATNQPSTVGSKILKTTARGATLLLTIEVSMLKDSNLASAGCFRTVPRLSEGSTLSED